MTDRLGRRGPAICAGCREKDAEIERLKGEITALQSVASTEQVRDALDKAEDKLAKVVKVLSDERLSWPGAVRAALAAAKGEK